MIKALEEARFQVITSQPDIVEINLIQKLPDIYIVYLEGDIVSFNGTLGLLKRLVTEDGKDRVLYLIGNPQEIASAYDIIPRGLVSSSFLRPINMRDVIFKLNNLITDEDNYDARHGNGAHLKRILVVDDDSVMLRTMKNWLSKKYEVSMVNSGMNAISFLATNRVDLILLDYEMPVISGLQVFEMLKTGDKTKDIPVIFLTGKDDKETVLKVISAKPEKYLLKNMPAEELLKAVDDFFHGR